MPIGSDANIPLNTDPSLVPAQPAVSQVNLGTGGYNRPAQPLTRFSPGRWEDRRKAAFPRSRRAVRWAACGACCPASSAAGAKEPRHPSKGRRRACAGSSNSPSRWANVGRAWTRWGTP